MVIRQVAESISRRYILELEKGMERSSPGIGFGSSSFLNID